MRLPSTMARSCGLLTKPVTFFSRAPSSRVDRTQHAFCKANYQDAGAPLWLILLLDYCKHIAYLIGLSHLRFYLFHGSSAGGDDR